MAAREELPLLSDCILFWQAMMRAGPGRRDVRPGLRFFFASAGERSNQALDENCWNESGIAIA